MLTVSDTRIEADDKSGKILVDNLTLTGHSLGEKTIVPDSIYQIRVLDKEIAGFAKYSG